MLYSTKQKEIKTNSNKALYAFASMFFGFAFVGVMTLGIGILNQPTASVYAGSNPTITVIGDNPVVLNEGDIYTEPGYVANDADDGDLTGSVTINNGGLNTTVPGTYTITYSVTDSDSNNVSATRTVIVNSTNTAPTITLIGSLSITLTSGDTYTEPGYTANDAEEGDVTGRVTINNGGLDTSVVGTYTITYSVSDTPGLTDTKTRTVIVNAAPGGGNTAPVITLLGANPVTLTVGGTYTEPGYTANDTEDGDITGSVVINNGGLDTSVVGTYTITYSVTDSGSLTDSKTRTVIVNAAPGGGNTAPVITLLGANPVTLTVGGTYTEPGYTANDTEDGDITGSVVINNGGLDTSVVGTYTITYSVTDSGSLTDSKTRTVIVNAAPVTPPGGCTTNCGGGGGSSNQAPVIYLLQIETVDMFAGQPFVDAPFRAEDNEDGIITNKVIVDLSNLDTTKVGSYKIFYNVKDKEGLQAPTRTRTVNVKAAPANGPITPTPTPTPTEPQQCEYLVGFSRLGGVYPENDPIEVQKVQFFLNIFEGANLEVNGVFNIATDAAVRAFQNKYKVDILDPWNHDASTGYVYLTTRKKINEIYCNREFPLTLLQKQEIIAFSNRIQTNKNNVGQTNPTPSLSDSIRNDGGITIPEIRYDDLGNPLIGTIGPDGEFVGYESNSNLATALEPKRSFFENFAIGVYETINKNIIDKIKKSDKTEDIDRIIPTE